MIHLRCLKLTSIHDWRTSYRTQRADRYTEKSHFSFDLNSLLFKFTKGEVERTLESPATRRVPALSHHQSGPVAPMRDLVLNTPNTVSPDVIPRTRRVWEPFLTLVSAFFPSLHPAVFLEQFSVAQ